MALTVTTVDGNSCRRADDEGGGEENNKTQRWGRTVDEPYRVFQRLNLLDSCHHGWSFLAAIVLLLALDRRYVSDRGKKPAVVEPIDPVERGQFDRFDGAPGSTTADDLGLVETDDRLGQGVSRTRRRESRSRHIVQDSANHPTRRPSRGIPITPSSGTHAGRPTGTRAATTNSARLAVTPNTIAANSEDVHAM